MIHKNYNRLTKSETLFVDVVFKYAFKLAKETGIKLAGNDTIEKAVEALATAVIESR